MATFKTKPIEIEAVQWTGHNVDEVIELTGADQFQIIDKPFLLNDKHVTGSIWISAYNKWFDIEDGWWIVRYALGSGLYPMQDSEFKETYLEVGPRVEIQLPVFMPDTRRDWTEHQGLATINALGEVTVRFKSPQDGLTLAEMAKQGVLLQVGFDYRMSVEDVVNRINRERVRKSNDLD